MSVKKKNMYNREYTPERIMELKPNEIFGIAGFKIEEMAPLFQDALGVENIVLPQEFVPHLL